MRYEEWNELTAFESRAGFALSDIQIQDVDTFNQWEKSLNRYEVGGGKTVISTVVSLMGDADTTVVIMPPILLLSWERWLNKVSERVLRFKGTPKERSAMVLKENRWVLMSHAIFRQDFDRVQGDLRGHKVDMIVDEAQAIKSPSSVLYKCVGRLSAGRRLQMLTGTPTSKPLDCYTYIKLKTPELYRSYAAFEGAHVAKRDFFGAVTHYQGLEALAENFSLKSIKRSKEEIHGYKNDPIFPDCTYELDAPHMKLYEKLMEEQLLLLPDGSKIDGSTATRLYHLMQQIVVNYDHFSGDPTKRSKAYDLLDQTIEETECLTPGRSKLIVWTYYKMTSRNVLNYLKGKGYYAVGAYSEVDSNKSFELFMNDPLCRIGVMQPQSAGAGLNPQAVCWESLYLELSTTPMLSRQSMGRLDRLGQKHKPTMRFGIASGTVQPSLLERLMVNDDLVSTVERTKDSLRKMLMGQNPDRILRSSLRILRC
jgi:hypothetical protein